MNIPLVDSHPGLRPKLPPSLSCEAIRILHQHELASGAVTDDLSQLEYYQIADLGSPRSFYVQFNSQRGNRPMNPKSSSSRLLSLNAIVAEGRQTYFTIQLHDRPWLVLANPWPFMPSHVTIALASKRQEPQLLRVHGPTKTREIMRSTVSDLVLLATALPSFVTVYNGPRAGASLPNERHYQSFTLPAGHGPLPIQQIEKNRPLRYPCTVDAIGLDDEYPLVLFRVRGLEEAVVSKTVELMEYWQAAQGDAATFNIISQMDGDHVSVILVPRNMLYGKAPGFNGTLGSLETSGVFVCSEQWELTAIRERMNYHYLWRLLSAARPPLALEVWAGYDG